MALTPEDVVNKRFQPTKFREGYDQDEVDDFLDEVVVELRRLNQENEEIRQRLIAGEARINELQRSAAAQAHSFGEQPAASAQPAFGTAPVEVAAPVAFPAPVAPTDVDPSAVDHRPIDSEAVDPNSTNNLLQLARKLHEEHVREGVEKRDALIAEGHATAARVVSDAEETQRQQLSTLEQERQSVENRINDLRSFEREYRHKLKSYIEGQLHELESPNSTPDTVPAGQPEPAQVGAQENDLETHQEDHQDGQPVTSPESQPVLPVASTYSPVPSTSRPTGYQGFGGN